MVLVNLCHTSGIPPSLPKGTARSGSERVDARSVGVSVLLKAPRTCQPYMSSFIFTGVHPMIPVYYMSVGDLTAITL